MLSVFIGWTQRPGEQESAHNLPAVLTKIWDYKIFVSLICPSDFQACLWFRIWRLTQLLLCKRLAWCFNRHQTVWAQKKLRRWYILLQTDDLCAPAQITVYLNSQIFKLTCSITWPWSPPGLGSITLSTVLLDMICGYIYDTKLWGLLDNTLKCSVLLRCGHLRGGSEIQSVSGDHQLPHAVQDICFTITWSGC